MDSSILIMIDTQEKQNGVLVSHGTAVPTPTVYDEKDVPLVARCLREWSGRLTDEKRELLLARLVDIALTSTKERTIVEAYKAILAAGELDLRGVQVAIQVAAAGKLLERKSDKPKRTLSDAELREGLRRLMQPPPGEDETDIVGGSDGSGDSVVCSVDVLDVA